MSKLSIHCQGLISGIEQYLAPMEYVKVMNPPENNPFPGKRVIARTYDQEDLSYVLRGVQGARDWYNKWLPFYKGRPWVYAWEAPNEPNPMWDYNLRKCLNEFTEELARIMGEAGLKLVAYNWSVGWPDTGQVHEFKSSLEAILKYGHFIGLHEYGAPFMNVTGHADGQSWWTLRYRRTFAEIRALGLRVPETFITECGLDGGCRTDDWEPRNIGYWPGWKYFCIRDGRSVVQGEEEYMSQLTWYDEEIMRDPEILAAFIFNSGDGGGWQDFELTPGLLGKISARVVSHPNPKPKSLAIIDMVGKLPTRYPIPKRELGKIEIVVVHHTAVKVRKDQPQTYYTGVHLPAIARGHVNTNGWETIAYHYAIDAMGRIYRLNPLDTISNHTFGNNERGIGIALLGSFQDIYNKTTGTWQVDDPTPAQIASTASLIRSLGKPFKMHRELVGTQCPGAIDHLGKTKTWWKNLKKLVEEN
jgi:hypothetical protein